MPTAEVRVYLNNQAASEERLAVFGEIRVDQAIGMATEAELHVDVAADEAGYWTGIEEDYAQPFARVRIEIKVGEGDFVPLVDGPIIGSRYTLSSAPEESEMVLVVQDDSVLLNQEEQVVLYEDMEAHAIAEQLFTDFGLAAEVESVAAAGSALLRATVQRGTAMQLLRELARRYGMFAYVRPGENPGESVGVFTRPILEPGDASQLLLMGPERNVERFSAEIDALKPLSATAGSVSIADKAELFSEAETSDLPALGDEPVHGLVPAPAKGLLARTREEQSDLDQATLTAVNLSSFAYAASTEVAADNYSGVLQPYQVVNVAGVSSPLSGAYLVSRVTHVIDDHGYRQSVQLRRNARSAVSSTPVPGGLQ